MRYFAHIFLFIRRRVCMFSSSEPIKAEIKNTKMKTSISMRDFFALAEVIALQEIQKRNAYGSKAHREAFDDMKALAATYGAASYLGEY